MCAPVFDHRERRQQEARVSVGRRGGRPARHRDLRGQVEHAPRAIFIAGESPRAFHRLGDVWDAATEPQADLVAEDPKSARPASADGTFGHDAPLVAAQIRDRRLLDHAGPL
jgi:hypothetical protein